MADTIRHRKAAGGSGAVPDHTEIALTTQAIGRVEYGKMVPLAGIEPALLAETDFESVASTS